MWNQGYIYVKKYGKSGIEDNINLLNDTYKQLEYIFLKLKRLRQINCLSLLL